MKHAAKIRRLYQVLGDLCNNNISETDGQWLQESLLSDVDVQRTYIDYMALHANLHAECASLDVSSSESSSGCELALQDVFSFELPGSNNRELSLHRTENVEGHASSKFSRLKPVSGRWALAIALAGIALFSSLLDFCFRHRLGSWSSDSG